MKRSIYFVSGILMTMAIYAEPLVIDHRNTDITRLSKQDIEHAKKTLHIGYGHTSHGSQITGGMKGLVGFANQGGLGMHHPNDIFAFNDGGHDGALDLEEGGSYGKGWLERDCGYWPTWYHETREYLNDPSHADVTSSLYT